MPVNYHHFRFHELIDCLRSAGLDAQANHLQDQRLAYEIAERALRATKQDLRARAEDILEWHYTKLRPFLRLCHQRRFDNTTNTKAVELDWI